MTIEFLLNGETVRLDPERPDRTFLDWLRDTRKLNGTKEGCNEGDCGACTVMVSALDADGGVHHQALNACILFLPQLHGKAVRTVEGLTGPKGELHPVQDAMITHHGSQCGFCTPGIVMSLVAAHQNGFRNHDDILAGNLCRCTGYAPIIRAAEAAAEAPIPAWINDTEALKTLARAQSLTGGQAVAPDTLAEFAAYYLANPEATIVGGATDIGLWVTKKLVDLDKVLLTGRVAEMRAVHVSDTDIRIGAAVTVSDVQDLIAGYHPDFAEMLRRYGSTQVRNAATLGGNIANGSPIGDGPPALIALGARLHLRRGDKTREIPLEDYFVSYGRQDRAEGEFVEAVSIPRQADTLKCYKISKRFDQDISALCGCFNIVVEDGTVTSARIAFGGMAATPARAEHVERALVGNPWTEQVVLAAMPEFARDFTPIDDMRASSRYRLEVAANLLRRCLVESQLGTGYTRVREVSA
jgi:xanthine dehydrogenase small subunit